MESHALDRPQQDHLAFIRDSIRGGRVYWTYHVNMRMKQRDISRREVIDACDSYEVVESYPPDRRLPCVLVLGTGSSGAFHVVFALDEDEDNVRIVTAYRPDPTEWDETLKARRSLS
jgi:hypothetical protein